MKARGKPVRTTVMAVEDKVRGLLFKIIVEKVVGEISQRKRFDRMDYPPSRKISSGYCYLQY